MVISQLSADDSGVQLVPGVVTDRSIAVVVADLHSALSGRRTIDQTNLSICRTTVRVYTISEIWDYMIIIVSLNCSSLVWINSSADDLEVYLHEFSEFMFLACRQMCLKKKDYSYLLCWYTNQCSYVHQCPGCTQDSRSKCSCQWSRCRGEHNHHRPPHTDWQLCVVREREREREGLSE